MNTQPSIAFKGIVTLLIILPMTLVFLHVFSILLMWMLDDATPLGNLIYVYAVIIALGHFLMSFMEKQHAGENAIVYKRGKRTIREIPYDAISDISLTQFKIHEALNIATLTIRRNDTKRIYSLVGLKNYQAIYEHIQARIK